MEFLSLDANNRIVGIRSGSYSDGDKSSSEYAYTNGNLTADHMSALYNVTTGEITFDEVYNQSRPVESVPTSINPSSIDPTQIVPAIKAALDEKAVSMGFSDIRVGANSNTSLSAWRTEVWSWARNQNLFSYSSVADIVNHMPVYVNIT